MKKTVGWICIVIMIVSLVTGCKKEDSITVYFVESDALYVAGIGEFIENHPSLEVKVEAFESYEAMGERLSNELEKGKGPDVMLFNSMHSEQDPWKLSQEKHLLQLDNYMQLLPKSEYYTGILDAGYMNGHQYFLPLSWNLLQAYTVEGDASDLYTAIPEEAVSLEEDANRAVSSLQFMRDDWLNLFMEIMGTSLLNTETGELLDDPDALKKTADYVKVFYDNKDKIRNITTVYSNDFAGAVSHLTYLIENYSFMNNLRFYQSVYQAYLYEDVKMGTFGQNAQIIQYGAINENTDNAAAAWELLKYLADMPASMKFTKYQEETVYYAPVSKSLYEQCVDELVMYNGIGPVTIEPLKAVYGEQLLEMPKNVSGVISNPVLGILIQDCMEPYMLGETEFDVCYETLMQKVELYLNE